MEYEQVTIKKFLDGDYYSKYVEVKGVVKDTEINWERTHCRGVSGKSCIGSLLQDEQENSIKVLMFPERPESALGAFKNSELGVEAVVKGFGSKSPGELIAHYVMVGDREEESVKYKY
ncbi:MAG: hypothetical protein ABIA78_02095 [archaeon]